MVGQQFVGLCWHHLCAPVSFLTSFPVHLESKQGGDGDASPLPQTLPVTRKVGEPRDRGCALMPRCDTGGAVLGKPRGALGTGDACGRRQCREDTAGSLPAGLPKTTRSHLL